MSKRKVTALLLSVAVMASAFPAATALAVEGNPQSEAEKEKAAEKKAKGGEKDGNTEEGEEEEVASVEDANEVIDSYQDEEIEWESVYIRNVEDFKEFSRNCWLDTWSQNKKVYLTEDISLSGENFVSIPTFGGYFDGQGHTISGFTVYKPVSYVGLFNCTQKSAVLVNLRVEGSVRPTGNQMVVGGIVGDNSGVLLNCIFDGTVKGSDYVGGITGYNEISGVLMDCETIGEITGAHYTGGTAGDNVGNIVGCLNKADVNVSNEDTAKSLEDISLEQYTTGIFTALDKEEDEKGSKLSTTDNTVDSGGIAGLSTGIIQNCVNEGNVGYEHVGYNTGGIVGRQSGYVYACANKGKVYGRKDVGGIVGQAEPYIAIDLSEDIVLQLSDHIDTMHDQIEKMLDDAGDQSDMISNRLSVIRDFADRAIDDTHVLADRTIDWTDSMMDSVNEAVNRFDYVLDETAKDDGVIDHMTDAMSDVKDTASDVKDTAKELGDMVQAMDIFQYMTSEEKAQYDQAKAIIENGGKEHARYVADATQAYENYYISWAADQEGGTYEYDLKPVTGSGPQRDRPNVDYDHVLDDGSIYFEIVDWVHYNPDTGETQDFPLTDGSDRAAADQEVQRAASQEMSNQASDIARKTSEYADKKYMTEHHVGYAEDMRNQLETMTVIASSHTADMTDAAREQLGEAVDSVEDAADDLHDAADNLHDAGEGTKDILKTLNDKEDIVFPRLGEDYHSTTGSLNSNLKNISENMGYLNDEMASSGDVIGDDLSNINDEFSEIMRLYTDAMDGVLDMDYSNIYEDESEENAEECIDSTVADCVNNGRVEADLNVSGIAGTMAIEYDFDLESDVTGIDDARANSTFLTRCVLRQNVNQANVTAQKSYVGGVCGLQEMGMVLRCENYGRIESTSGDYVGGIAGQSISHIKNSYAKCTVSGGEYVAGIVGYGYGIENCCAMIKVKEAEAFSGAIAGKVTDNAEIADNFFVSDEIAGIDRISYSGMAEPVSYKTLLEMEGIPTKFRNMKITFYADDEEVGTAECPFGGSVALDKYPTIPAKEGFYADWDNKELVDVRVDEDVTVEYVRYLTTLAGSWMRENNQSSLLVDGMFAQEDEITVDKLGTTDVQVSLPDAQEPEELTECWQIEIPDDGAKTHQIRYQAPQGQTEGVEIYVQDTGAAGWKKAETELMGIYFLFPAEGNSVKIAVSVTQKGIMDYIVFIVAGAVVLILLIVLIVHKKRKKRRTKKAEMEAVEESAEDVEK